MKKSKSIIEKYVYVGKNGVVQRDVYIKRKKKKMVDVSFCFFHLNTPEYFNEIY